MFKKIAFYGFSALFLATMLWVTSAAWLGVSQPAGNVLLIAVVLCALFVALYQFVLRRANALAPHKQNKLVAALFMLFIIAATVFGCLTMTFPVSDLEVLCEAVGYWVANGDLGHYNYYFTVCANTLGNCIFLYFIFKPLSYFGLSMGSDTAECIAIFINVLMIALAVFLLYRIACRLCKEFSAQLLFLLLSLSFAPYYLWAHRYYSDTLSMPFAPLAIWLYLRSNETEHRAKQIAYGAAAGICLWVGYFIKGSALIALPALLIFAAFALPWKAALRFCVPMLLAVCLCFGGWELYRNNNQWIRYENEARDKYPTTMWLLYGAHGTGNYNDDDVNFLAELPDYETRSIAAKERLTAYYSTYTPTSYLSFLTTKFTATWSGALYDAQHYLAASRHGNWTHYFIMQEQRFYPLTQYYCNGWHYAFLGMLLLSTAAACRHPRWDAGLLLRICLFGLTLFLCFWETKPRYLLSFAPFFPLFFAQGVLCLSAMLDKPLRFLRGKKQQ